MQHIVMGISFNETNTNVYIDYNLFVGFGSSNNNQKRYKCEFPQVLPRIKCVFQFQRVCY